MPKICYTPKRFGASAAELIDRSNSIIAEYQRQGYVLTLRQLYYQLVSRDVIPNNLKSYKRLVDLVSTARLAGLIDWSAIEDRTRNLHQLSAWDSPASIVDVCARTFHVNPWLDQPWHVEVWIEKEALAGVFQRACDVLDVPLLPCRGYMSQSELWAAAERLKDWSKARKKLKILHFGDHDPSGLDMTRDLKDRLETFGVRVELERIALNRDQVEEFGPPPNPAKATDARFAGYQAEHGDESWELDALDPATLAGLVDEHVRPLIVQARWDEAKVRERVGRQQLKAVSDRWDEAVTIMEAGDGPSGGE